MPHSEISMYPKQQLAVVLRSGDLSLEQLIEGVNTLFADPAFNNITNIISDLTHASLVVKGEEFTKYAEHCRRLPRASAIAVAIVAPGDANFGLSRMFQTVSQLPRMFVVRSLPEAYERLGIPMEIPVASES